MCRPVIAIAHGPDHRKTQSKQAHLHHKTAHRGSPRCRQQAIIVKSCPVKQENFDTCLSLGITCLSQATFSGQLIFTLSQANVPLRCRFSTTMFGTFLVAPRGFMSFQLSRLPRKCVAYGVHSCVPSIVQMCSHLRKRVRFCTVFRAQLFPRDSQNPSSFPTRARLTCLIIICFSSHTWSNFLELRETALHISACGCFLDVQVPRLC